jgi:hypothetical protein
MRRHWPNSKRAGRRKGLGKSYGGQYILRRNDVVSDWEENSMGFGCELRSGIAPICFALALSGCTAAPPAPPPPTTPVTATSAAPVSESDTATVRARVIAINHDTREITLRGPAGNTETVLVSDEVRNFDRIRRGDNVVITYHQSIAYELHGPNVSVPSATVTEGVEQAPQGGLPGGVASRRITITGLVAGVDLAAHTISLVDQRGGAVHTFNVLNPQRQEDLKKVKVGDKLTVIFTEAIAVSVEPAGRA